MYYILKLLAILMKTLRLFNNAGRYPEPFFPESSHEKFTWCMDLTAVLVGNHICWTTGKEARCEKYLKVICLTMSSYFAQTFNSKIRRNSCKLLQPTSNIWKMRRARKGSFIALVSEKRYSNRNQHWQLTLKTEIKVTTTLFYIQKSHFRHFWRLYLLLQSLTCSAHLTLPTE